MSSRAGDWGVSTAQRQDQHLFVGVLPSLHPPSQPGLEMVQHLVASHQQNMHGLYSVYIWKLACLWSGCWHPCNPLIHRAKPAKTAPTAPSTPTQALSRVKQAAKGITEACFPEQHPQRSEEGDDGPGRGGVARASTLGRSVPEPLEQSKSNSYLMQRAGSLEKTLMLGKIEGRRRRGRKRMRWLDGITDSVDMSLRKLTAGNN